MSTDQLGTALRDLVHDVEEGLRAPVADELWAGGRRRRHTARLVPLVAAACVVALVTLALWPAGAPRASVPAVKVDVDGRARLTAYPSAIPKPPFVSTTTRPGVTAAVLTEGTDGFTLYAVSPTGVVRELDVPDAASTAPAALSPDGRWLARGGVLTDLVSGATVPSEPVRARLASTRAPSSDAAWWSPDSRRVYVAADDHSTPGSSGFVVGIDGTVTTAPLLASGQVPVVAGWLDADTVLAFVGFGDGSVSYGGRTWRVGSPTWEIAGADIQWPAAEVPVGSQAQPVRAGLSPDGSRLLVTRRFADAGAGAFEATEAILLDARTGASLGMPGPDGTLSPSTGTTGVSLTWAGWGCRPAWRGGLPVTTDDRIRRAVTVLGDDLVDVSSRYDSPCVAFAGNDLRGTPTTDTVAVWQERLWVWGGRVLAVVGLGALVWWFTRRRSWREGSGSEPPPYFLPSRG